MTKRQKRIIAAWDMFEEQDPDISTERLYAMVRDYTGYDEDLISDALLQQHIENKQGKR